MLWHSLFVDSHSWLRLRRLLGHDRRLILIDGPGHGEKKRFPVGYRSDPEKVQRVGARSRVDVVAP